MKPFLHYEWRAVAVPGFLLYAVPEIQILRRKSTTFEMGKIDVSVISCSSGAQVMFWLVSAH